MRRAQRVKSSTAWRSSGCSWPRPSCPPAPGKCPCQHCASPRTSARLLSLAPAQDEGASALWRELSAELPTAEDRLAGAAAAATAALARGVRRLPPDVAAGLRQGVPGLLSVSVRREDSPAGVALTATGDGDNGGNGSDAGSGGASSGSGGGTAAATLSLPLGEDSNGGTLGRCTFQLSSPPSAAEQQALASFAGLLAQQLEQARHHLAKERLEVRSALLCPSAKSFLFLYFCADLVRLNGWR